MNNIKIIAEIGVNHNGSLHKAKKLVEVAKSAGADYVKFQYFKSTKLVSKNCDLTVYQSKTMPNEKNQLSLLKKYEFSKKDIQKVKSFCKKKNIKFFCSIFSEDDFEYINKINQSYMKIPSGEMNNFFILNKIKKSKKKIIISTGASKYSEIKRSVNFLKKNNNNVCVMHCVTKYPTKLSDLNLDNINVLKNTFNTEVGFSDHTKSLKTGLYAALLGATIIEKHITLNNKLNGPDHKASLNPKNFKKYVKNIRLSQIILGSKKKLISEEENENKKLVRKSLVAKKNIKKGEIFTLNKLTALRPGNGKDPFDFLKFKGKKSKKNYRKYEIIK